MPKFSDVGEREAFPPRKRIKMNSIEPMQTDAHYEQIADTLGRAAQWIRETTFSYDDQQDLLTAMSMIKYKIGKVSVLSCDKQLVEELAHKAAWLLDHGATNEAENLCNGVLALRVALLGDTP